MKFGMTDAQYSILEELVIKPLKARNCQVYIFGSRANGTQHSHSDIDLLFKVPEEQTLPNGFLSKIKEDIEESRFPFIVELVNEDELASSYRNNVFSSRVAV